MKKVLAFACGLLMMAGAMAQDWEPTGNARVSADDIRFWTGKGTNKAVVAVTWNDNGTGYVGIAWGVWRQIAYCIGQWIVLAHLVARGREEGEQHLMVGVQLAVALQHGTRLFEFAKAGGMEPYGRFALCQAVYRGGHLFPSGHHLTRLLVAEQGCQPDA